MAFGVELVSVHDDVPLGVPIPRPTATVEDGLRLARVTLTVPACVTVNVNMLDPCTASVPENASVGGVVGVGDVELSSRRPQPAATRTDARHVSVPSTRRIAPILRRLITHVTIASYRGQRAPLVVSPSSRRSS